MSRITKRVLPLLCLVIPFASDAQTNAPSNSEQVEHIDHSLISSSIVSRTVSNIFVVFRNEQAVSGKTAIDHCKFPSDKSIRFGFVSATNSGCMVFLPRPEFAFTISAKSSNGKWLEPTRLGKNYGEEASSLTNYAKDKLDMSRRPGDQHPDHERPYLVMAPTHFNLTRNLPPPENLFEINDKGTYEMWLQVQVFISPSEGGKLADIHLVNFPPVKLDVVKD